ncbi:hypothetical protein ACQ4PT_023984 [Festuca glaucescens]
MDSGSFGGGHRSSNAHGGVDGEWRRWAVLVATVWVQALTGTNFDFSAYSSTLKASMGVSRQSLNYLATASDLGKAFGWSSGLALLYMPLPAVLLLSAVLGLMNLKQKHQRLGLILVVFLVCLVAGCSICWFNTVCFVICIRSFSASNRPLALSLSISFNGLSAAFYTLFANTLSPYSPSVYLLLNAILPLVVSIVALPAILLCHPHDRNSVRTTSKHDRRVFLGFYIIAFVTGIYLVIFGSVRLSPQPAPLHGSSSWAPWPSSPCLSSYLQPPAALERAHMVLTMHCHLAMTTRKSHFCSTLITRRR